MICRPSMTALSIDYQFLSIACFLNTSYFCGLNKNKRTMQYTLADRLMWPKIINHYRIKV